MALEELGQFIVVFDSVSLSTKLVVGIVVIAVVLVRRLT